MAKAPNPLPRPKLLPLGDRAMLVRFAEVLSEEANLAAIDFARALEREPIEGVAEIAPNLVSVLLRYEPAQVSFETLAGELRLRLALFEAGPDDAGKRHEISVSYGGAEGPDLAEVCEALGKSASEFKNFHTGSAVRVLATGFAPGFVYLGLHGADWTVPRRKQVREQVPEGSVLFAAGQTAITATPIRSGWPIIGRTEFRNFEVFHNPPVKLLPGDRVRFRASTR
jgi:KipI family sensor histidine kinase inhibitor